MKPTILNLYNNLPETTSHECFTPLLQTQGILIERIVSNGQSTAKDTWLEQEQHEWVIVLQGSAALQFEGESETKYMGTGDYVEIPAYCRHRVECTDSTQNTVWLAIHFNDVAESKNADINQTT